MLIRVAVFVDEDAALPPRLPLPRFVLFSWIRMEKDAHRKQRALSVCDDAAARSARCAKVSFYFRNKKQLNKSRTPPLKTFPGHFSLSFLRSLAGSLAHSLVCLCRLRTQQITGGDLHIIKGINIHCRVFYFIFIVIISLMRKPFTGAFAGTRAAVIRRQRRR